MLTLLQEMSIEFVEYHIKKSAKAPSLFVPQYIFKGDGMIKEYLLMQN